MTYEQDTLLGNNLVTMAKRKLLNNLLLSRSCYLLGLAPLPIGHYPLDGIEMFDLDAVINRLGSDTDNK